MADDAVIASASPVSRLASRSLWSRTGLLVMLVVGAAVGLGFAVSGAIPVDTAMVWRAAHAPTYYGTSWAADLDSRYVYPPVLAQVVGLLPLDWPSFVIVWQTLVFAGLWAALRWWTLPVFVVSATAAALDGFAGPVANPVTLLLVGNIQALVVASVVVGLRHPAAWSFGILTKITPGFGLVWFAARREWQPLARALLVTAAITAVSFLLDPAAWAEFARFAVANANTPSPLPVIDVPLVARLPLTIMAIAWAARHDRPWVVPLALGFAAIALYQWSWATYAAAALPLLHRGAGRADDAEVRATPTALAAATDRLPEGAEAPTATH